MSVDNSFFSKIVKNLTAVTLMALSSVSAFAMSSSESKVITPSRKVTRASDDQQLTLLSSRIGFQGGLSDIEEIKIEAQSNDGPWKLIWQLNMGDPASESQLGVHVYGPETDGNANTWSTSQHDTYRVAGDNPDARIPHSAVSFKLLNKDIQKDATYELIVSHRTKETGPLVRIYDPGTGGYINLQKLPQSSEFIDTSFDLKEWNVESMRGGARGPEESLAKETSYLSFINGKSDIHSLTLKSNGKTIKQVILGDATSESQPGVHVYAPEKDPGDIKTNQWSKAHEPTHYFRTAGDNLNAINKHATLSFKLPNELVQINSDYRLSVTHRSAPGAKIKMFDVRTKGFQTPMDLTPSKSFITQEFPLDPSLIMLMLGQYEKLSIIAVVNPDTCNTINDAVKTKPALQYLPAGAKLSRYPKHAYHITLDCFNHDHHPDPMQHIPFGIPEKDYLYNVIKDFATHPERESVAYKGECYDLQLWTHIKIPGGDKLKHIHFSLTERTSDKVLNIDSLPKIISSKNGEVMSAHFVLRVGIQEKLPTDWARIVLHDTPHAASSRSSATSYGSNLLNEATKSQQIGPYRLSTKLKPHISVARLVPKVGSSFAGEHDFEALQKIYKAVATPYTKVPILIDKLNVMTQLNRKKILLGNSQQLPSISTI